MMKNLVDISQAKPKVNTREAISIACENLDFNRQTNFKEKLEEIENLVLNENKEVSGQALSNCRGSWYEWLLAHFFFNIWVNDKRLPLIIPLPNIASFDCAKLYIDEVNEYVFDLREKLKATLGISLITSNPDFVILDMSNIKLEGHYTAIKKLDNSSIEFIDTFYKKLIGKCDFKSVIGYLATKTSLRPDRRLQIVHEGNLTKAVYVHIQTRLWEQNPKGIRYFGASMKLNDKDKEALRTVATHSITTVSSMPDRSVDELFQIQNTEDLKSAFNSIVKICGHEY